MAEIRDLDLDLIKIAKEIQPRERLDKKPLEALTQLIQEDGAEAVPPIDVFYDSVDGKFWLADGHYRVNAARAALSKGGPPALRAEVHQGTKRDAFIFAAGANKHGTQLTNKEKRRAVERLLRDNELKMNDNEIARHVGVSNGFVSSIHRELRDVDSQEESLHEAKIPQPRTTTYMRKGKTVTIRSDNIGKGRGKKAKTETPTTPPTISADPQDEPHTDADDEPNANADVERTTEDNHEAADSKGFDDLKAVWRAATREERRAFLDWLDAQPVDSYAGDTAAQAKRYESILSDVRNTFEAYTQ